MNFNKLTSDYQARARLEKAALMTICACYYYDLADAIDSITDEELERLISDTALECKMCKNK